MSVAKPHPAAITAVDKWLAEWCEDKGVTITSLRAHRPQTRWISAIRHEAAAALYREFDLSAAEVGWFLNRDHSTVLYAVRKVGDAA